MSRFGKNEYAKKYYQEHKQERLDKAVKWQQEHKEERIVYMKKYRLLHKEEMKVKAKAHYLANHENILSGYRERAKELKTEVLGFYSKSDLPKCVRCGIDDLDVLCIDHVDGGGNTQRKSIGMKSKSFYRWLKRNKFPEGYQTLCANCNLKKKIQEKEY
jgi:hypothetical protein